MLVKQAMARLANAEAILKRRVEARDHAIRARLTKFGAEMMKGEAKERNTGLNFGNLDEFRSLRYSPPPLVQLVVRCVASLICCDDIGDVEALETASQASLSTSNSSIARGTHGVTHRRPATASARMAAAQERLQQAAAASFQVAAVRRSDVPRATAGELLDWEESLRLLRRSDFKWRLLRLNATSLLDNQELVAVVNSCLDLRSIRPDETYSVLPGRAFPGDFERQATMRRELTSMLYANEKEEGVARNPLRFEEARYANGVAGAMLIWMQRILSRHAELTKLWERLSDGIDHANIAVIPARRKYNERLDELEALLDEYNWAPRLRHLYCTPYHQWEEKLKHMIDGPMARV